MADFYRVGARLSLAGILSLSAMSCYANGWSEDFLSLTGTVVAFDSAAVQNALINDKSPDLGQLLKTTCLHSMVQKLTNQTRILPLLN